MELSASPLVLWSTLTSLLSKALQYSCIEYTQLAEHTISITN